MTAVTAARRCRLHGAAVGLAVAATAYVVVGLHDWAILLSLAASAMALSGAAALVGYWVGQHEKADRLDDHVAALLARLHQETDW